MYAVSLVGSISRIDERAQELLELNTFADGAPAAAFADAQEILCEVAELLDSHRPFRLSDHDERAQTAVRRVAETVYERGQVRPAAVESDPLSVAKADAGLVVRNGWLFVPLGRSDPAAGNWRPVFDVLVDRLEGIRDRYTHIAKRLRGSAQPQPLCRACETVRGMLDVLQRCLEQLSAVEDYVNTRTDQNQTDLLEAAKQQAATISGDTDA